MGLLEHKTFSLRHLKNIFGKLIGPCLVVLGAYSWLYTPGLPQAGLREPFGVLRIESHCLGEQQVSSTLYYFSSFLMTITVLELKVEAHDISILFFPPFPQSFFSLGLLWLFKFFLCFHINLSNFLQIFLIMSWDFDRYYVELI